MDAREILEKMVLKVPDILAYLLIRSDGTIVVSKPMPGIDERKLATLSAAILGIAKRSSQELNFGELYQVIINTENGDLYIIEVKNKGLLAVIAKHAANASLILLEMERAAYKLEKIM